VPALIFISTSRIIETGRHIIVIWENVLDDPKTVYPVTAYDVPPRRS
jgi:hypothetical protein